MKDSLILEGKTYISARRAARILNYAQDYIGQLCRAGKLDCKMVGRSWFVTEESLIAHRENAVDSTNDRITKIIKNVKEEVVAAPAVTQPVKSPFVYETEKAPLLPPVTKKAPAVFSLPKIEPIVSPVASLDVAGATKIAFMNPVAGALIALCLIVGGFVVSNSFSYFNKGSTISHSASVGSAIEGILEKILANFGIGNRWNLAKEASSINTPSEISPSSDFNGIGVLPASGSDAADEASKAKIKNSFSDEVTIYPDQSGTAGIIKPVFKKTNGDDFVYVLVPVKEKQQ